MGNKNYLFGFGERLTEKVPPPKTNPQKSHPYTIESAVKRLSDPLTRAVESLNGLPEIVCPSGEAVLPLTIHPSYLSKSYFPSSLLNLYDLRTVGSRPISISPERVTQKKVKDSYLTTTLFVAGKRDDFQILAENIIMVRDKDVDIGSLESSDIRWLEDFRKIEKIQSFKKGERVRRSSRFRHSNQNLYEVVLHCSQDPGQSYIIDSFIAYAQSIGASVDVDRRIYSQGLCFVPVYTDKKNIEALEQFTFLRVMRRMPALDIRKKRRRSKRRVEYELPKAGATDLSIQTAIFDGGMPSNTPLLPWANYRDLVGGSEQNEEDLSHGEAVTSAYLFGSIEPGNEIEAPFTKVDHYKVYDENLDEDDDLFDVLERIKSAVEQKDYDFINVSLGPSLPIEDDEVHVWTAAFDEMLSSGRTLASLAVGNDGDLDRLSGNARIQVPSDCVNGMAVGAANSASPAQWRRAEYSSVGPGRSPGYIKPDLIAFGGDDDEPFFVVDSRTPSKAQGDCGTSFSAPLALRTAAGLRATMGSRLNSLTCKALLIHHTENGSYPTEDVGWGRIPTNIDSYLTSDSASAKIIYQGRLEPSKYVRARIPMISGLPGLVTVKATFCFACEVNSQEPSNYTNGGLEITFRPDSMALDKTQSFFSSAKLFPSESDLRNDAHKWEPVLHNSVRKHGKNFHDPVFDIHYLAREGASSAKAPDAIPYSLVITVEAPNEPNLYNKIAQKYRTQLEIMQPIAIEIQNRG